MPRRGSNRPFGANGLKQRDLAGTYATTVGKVRDEWKGAYLSLVKAPHDQYIRTVLINTPSEKQELDSRGLEHYGQNRPGRSRPKDVALSTYPRAFACANTSLGVRRPAPGVGARYYKTRATRRYRDVSRQPNHTL